MYMDERICQVYRRPCMHTTTPIHIYNPSRRGLSMALEGNKSLICTLIDNARWKLLYTHHNSVYNPGRWDLSMSLEEPHMYMDIR